MCCKDLKEELEYYRSRCLQLSRRCMIQQTLIVQHFNGDKVKIRSLFKKHAKQYDERQALMREKMERLIEKGVLRFKEVDPWK